MADKTKVRASIVELHSRKIEVNKSKDGNVYWNGEDNLYPIEIERVVVNSPTASRAAKVMGKYIAGRGLTDESQDIVVNARKNYKVSNVISLIGQDCAAQGGSFIHVSYGLGDNGLLKQRQLDILDYSKCRIDKEDDAGYEGKIRYKDYSEKKSAIGGNKKGEDKWYYPYNPNPEVVRAQIEADYGSPIDEPDEFIKALKKYRGQVYYFNLTPQYKYALAPVDSVYNDADSEYRISLYTNMQVRSGFLGKTAVLTQGLDEEQADAIKKDISEWLGAENSDNVYHMDVANADNLDQVLKVIQLAGQYNEKMFTETNTRLRKNILGSFNNIPEPLLFASEGALFGTSADTYTEMKLFYSEQTEDERYRVEETMKYLGFPCTIKPIVIKEVTEQDAEAKRQDAQATLRGSVGGVTALIQLQQSVSQGYTSISAAVEIVKSIYGIEESIAKKMIGDPVETQPETPEENATA